MRKLAFIVAASTAVYALPAFAAEGCCRPVPNWYAGLGGSVVFLDDVTRKEAFPTIGTDSKAPDVNKFMYSAGFGLSGNFGYRFSHYFRGEAEIGYRSNDTSGIVATPTGSSINGRGGSYSGMLNGYFDYYNSTRLTPYVGLGIGYAYLDGHYIDTYHNSGDTAQETHKLQGWAPAYQFKAGVSYDASVGSQPIEMYLGYTHFTTGDVTVKYHLDNYSMSFSNTVDEFELGGRIYIF